MKWSSAVSDNIALKDAFDEAASKIVGEMEGVVPNVLLCFVSAHHAMEFDEIPAMSKERFGGALLVGCSGGGIIGEGKEIEHRPGLSLTAASLPGVDVGAFHVDEEELPDGDAPPQKWHEAFNTTPEGDPSFVLLADPFSIHGEHILMGLDYAYPASVKIGGLASGSQQARGNALYLGDKVFDTGIVGISLKGNVTVDTVVAQGCRPIGGPLHITKCHRNILEELNGQTPFEVLKEIFEGLDARDKQLVQHSLFLGVVMDELNDAPKLGDFLIRNIIGIDPRQGVIAVGEALKEGQTVQFHLRDADTSSDDLNLLLSNYVKAGMSVDGAGALLFQCLGRGAGLYGRPNHDTDMFAEKVGAVPLAGFFCNGEIGPVGGTTFMHGYTSSFGIFRPREGKPSP
jgi:small ligand-binding sensory domain FIST